MDYVIKTENLGKAYRIGHHRADRGRTFRDLLAHSSRSLVQRVRHPLSPNRENVQIENFWALSDINLELQPGERLGIIGRNGAGKSTLLKILSRITEPTTGRVRIRGRIASLLEVGTGFHPDLTGRENIFLNGAILGMTRRDIRNNFDQIVAFAEIEKFLDTPVKRYSTGMYVRLAFAIAAHLEPDILIVDEVLAVGDAHFQKKCLGKMGEVGKAGRTIIFVSHNMGFIQQLTSKVMVIDQGKKVFQGNTAAGINLYLKESASQTATGIETHDPDFFINRITLAENRMEKGFNKPLLISADLSLNKSYSRISFGMGIHNTLGARIATAKFVAEKLEKGSRRLTIAIRDHHLPPGEYYLSLGIGRGGDIFRSDNIISFELSDNNVTDPLLLPYLSSQRDKIGAFLKADFEIDA